jgi:hypothetical protein
VSVILGRRRNALVPAIKTFAISLNIAADIAVVLLVPRLQDRVRLPARPGPLSWGPHGRSEAHGRPGA